MANTVPTLTGLDTPIDFIENTVNATPQVIDAAVVFTDPDGNFDGSTLTVSNLLAEDSVSINDQGAGAGEIGFSGGNVTFGGTLIGTAAGGAGATLTITFNAAATTAAIDALIQNLTYANTSDTPTADRTLEIKVTDADGFAAIAPITFAEQTGAANPFDGVGVGFSSSPTFADLDGDGDLDAVVGEGDGTLNYFENTGTATSPVFTVRTGAANPFDGAAFDVGSYSTPSFADLDGDGDLDAVVGEIDGNLNYFENTGTAAAPLFTVRTGAANPFDVATFGAAFDVGGNSAPTFADLDGDGDLDAVVGEIDGNLNYFENTGSAIAPAFTERTGVDNPFDVATFGAAFDVGILSTPSFADFDGDGDLDAIVGENGVGLNYFENTGSATEPLFVARTGAANPFDAVDVGANSAPSFADLDGDGDLDAVVGEGLGTLDYFENTTPPAIAPDFVEVTGAANPFDGAAFDVGGYNAPAFADLDGDGDLDVLVGEVNGGLRYFRNDGTAIAPTFVEQTGAANPFDGAAFDVGDVSTPTFVDLDGDGDLDAVVGEFLGNLNYFMNTGTVIAPAFTAQTGGANPFNGVDVGISSTPSFADLDGDGDLDAVVGEGGGGELSYFENTGTATAPAFTVQTGAANPFDGVSVRYGAPTFADLDGDGDLDAIVGDEIGAFRYFENTGTAVAAIFTERTGAANPFDGIDVNGPGASAVTTPAFADLDGDGDLDLVAGEINGTFHYFRNTGAGFELDVHVDAQAEPQSTPVLAGLDSPVTFDENTVNAAPGIIDAAVVFTDPDGNFDGGTLTVSGLLAEDFVSIRDQGAGAGEIGVLDVDVTYEGIVIGSFTGGNASPLIVTFNTAATSAAIDALIQNLTYANSSDTPTASRTLELRIVDAGGAAAIAPITFAEQTGAANPFDGATIDGSNKTPAFADLDGDGDLDAVVGENDGTLNYLENTGTATSPVFTVRTGAANPFDGAAFDVGNYSTPSFADLDGDGDLDAVVGEIDGNLNYFENTGTAAAPLFTVRTGAANPFDVATFGAAFDVGGNSAPTFADLDGDGDLDAVVGEEDGVLNYFMNTGTATAPVFAQQTGATNPFNGIDVGFSSAPSFADLDGDGDLDAVVGDQVGSLNYFENTGSATEPLFVARTGAANPFDAVDAGGNSAPSFADLDGDGDLDAVVGDNGGNLHYFRNTGAGLELVIDVAAQDDGPIAHDDNVSVAENGTLDGDVFADNDDGPDADPDGGPGTVFSVTAVNGNAAAVGSQIVLPSGALLTLNADGTFRYDPNHAFDTVPAPGSGASNTPGFDDFSYTITGGSTATVVVAITGVDSDDILLGTMDADTLKGGGGADRMLGDAGDDVYFVDSVLDVVVENPGEGIDTVHADFNYIIGANVEQLYLEESAGAATGVGNGEQNLIVGNSFDNALDGSSNNDQLEGGGGNDTLFGGTGTDGMIGGTGNDTYFVDSVFDLIVENAGEGIDTVYANSDYIVGTNVEQLYLQESAGTAAGVGNGEQNLLVGNSFDNALDGGSNNDQLEGGGGNDTLEGGAGTDGMIGGAGNDTYFVDSIFDVIVENAGEGIDTVYASSNYIIGANVEQLYLQESAGTATGVGNGEQNLLIGNSFANALDGGSNNDTLRGGGGDDTLFGGTGIDGLYGEAGNDHFVFNPGTAAGDMMVDFAGNGAAAGDHLSFVGFGAGATFTQQDATHWVLTYNGGANTEIITFQNAASIDATDFQFL